MSNLHAAPPKGKLKSSSLAHGPKHNMGVKSAFAAGTIDATPAGKPTKDMGATRSHNKAAKSSFTE